MFQKCVHTWKCYAITFKHTKRGCPLCRLCKESSEHLEQILSSCSIYIEVRERIIDEMEKICLESKSEVNFSEIRKNPKYLAQFILDCGSLNLPSRFSTKDSSMHKIFKLSRDLCYYMKKTRAEKLKNLWNSCYFS